MIRLLPLVTLILSTPALAENLNPLSQRHSVDCVLAEACAMKKPPQVGNWELLTKNMTLQEKAEGHWLADLSKLKSIAKKAATFHVLSLEGQMIEVNVRLVDSLPKASSTNGTINSSELATEKPSESKPAKAKKPRRQKTAIKCN